MRLHPVTNRDDHVEVEELDLINLPVGGSCCKICNNSFPRQFPILEHVLDVPRDDRLVALEQLRQLIERQPDGLILQPDFEARSPVLRLVEHDLGIGFRFAVHRCNRGQTPKPSARYRRCSNPLTSSA
jgi:hypothetical protein